MLIERGSAEFYLGGGSGFRPVAMWPRKDSEGRTVFTTGGLDGLRIDESDWEERMRASGPRGVVEVRRYTIVVRDSRDSNEWRAWRLEDASQG